MAEHLKVAIVHYHLRRGGVTRIIERTLNAFNDKSFKFCVLTGEEPADGMDAHIGIVEALGYGSDTVDAANLAADCRAKARECLGELPDLWHIHNHSLGKNLASPLLVERLAGDGERILLQPHDFAEDCRPANYRLLNSGLGKAGMDRLYPHSDRIHYAVLNRRDHDSLLKAGAPTERLHLLPNPVPRFKALETKTDVGEAFSDRRLILYPTRAIRRKNLGEFLLWAAVADDSDCFGVTLAPKNPVEQPLYNRWKKLAEELFLPMLFDLGTKYTLEELFAVSEFAVTTSLTEGFGMAFLEPWLASRPVVGRDLPEITSDFKDMGINMDSCYDRLDIPLEMAGKDAVKETISDSREKMLRAYGKIASDEDTERTLAAAVQNRMVDFGCLDENLQSKVLRSIVDSKEGKRMIENQLLKPSVKDVVEKNARLIEQKLSLDNYGNAVDGMYQSLMDAPDDEPDYLAGESILDSFLAPERFRVLLAP